MLDDQDPQSNTMRTTRKKNLRSDHKRIKLLFKTSEGNHKLSFVIHIACFENVAFVYQNNMFSNRKDQLTLKQYLIIHHLIAQQSFATCYPKRHFKSKN